MWWVALAWAEEPRAFHHSELELKTRVDPVFPESMRASHTGDVRCLVEVFIAEDGVPYDVVPTSCPEPYVTSIETALLQWRWYPPMDGGQPVKAKTTVAITFRMNEPASIDGVRIQLGLGAGVQGQAPAFAWHTRIAGYKGVYAEFRVESAVQKFSLAQGYFRNELCVGPGRWWGPVALGAFVGLGMDSAFRFWPDVLRVPVGVAAAVEPHPLLVVEVTTRGSYVLAAPEVLREPVLGPAHDLDVSLDLWLVPFEDEGGRYGFVLGGHHLALATGPMTVGWLGIGNAPARD